MFCWTTKHSSCSKRNYTKIDVDPMHHYVMSFRARRMFTSSCPTQNRHFSRVPAICSLFLDSYCALIGQRKKNTNNNNGPLLAGASMPNPSYPTVTVTKQLDG